MSWLRNSNNREIKYENNKIKATEETMNFPTPVVETQGSTADKEEILCTYQRFLQLSSFLFEDKESCIYNINEIPENSPFYKDAVNIAKQLNISWKHMSHSNSNRIMLALLEDYFQAMQKIEQDSHIDVITKLIFKHAGNNDKTKG